jgi:predicted metal-dependent peptidase
MEDNFIAKARSAALKRMPYLGHILYYMRPIATDKVPIAGVSKSGVMYYNPERFSKMSEDEMAIIILHESFHILQNTFARKGNKDHYRWNIASDICINDILEGEGMTLPVDKDGKCMLYVPRTFSLPRFKASEYYYEHMPEGVKTTFADLVDFDEEDPRSAEDVDIARRICGLDIKKHSEQHGNVPEGIIREIEDLLDPPKRNWKKIFRNKVKFVTNQVIGGKFDYSYQRLARRESDIIMPGLLSYDAKLGVLLDTSGSMDADLLNECMAQVKHISKLFSEIWFLSIDTEVHTCFKLKRSSDLFKHGNVKGGGGTRLGPGFAELMKKEVNVCVAISDCYADFGEKPNFPVVWMCKQGGHGDPPWGDVIEID